MGRIVVFLGILFAAMLPWSAKADPADIDAAARGVVRVVMIELDGNRAYYAGHGTGFAVTPKLIVTNAHVVRRMLNNKRLGIGIIPSEGDDPSAGRLVDYDAKRDLALIEISGSMRLPELTLTTALRTDEPEVVAIGYPGVVDDAQGLVADDMIRAMAPVTSRGFLSGKRSMPGFDALMHNVPIAGGNSGGPLVDDCGRVLGVNTSGTLSRGSEAEFFFAIAMNELMSFLRKNDVKPVLTDARCRSLAEIEREEDEREEAERKAAEDAKVAAEKEQEERETALRSSISSEVQEERENMMAFAAVLLLIAAGGAAMAVQANGQDGGRNRAMVFGGIAALSAAGALYLWLTRPGNEDIEQRFLDENNGSAELGRLDGGSNAGPLGPGSWICTLDSERSRITGKPDTTVPFDWSEGGCVNSRTQYGRVGGKWTRVLVPNESDVVSVVTIEPDERLYTVERFLIGRTAMEAARTARQSYSPPTCGSPEAATKLGDMQGSVTSKLPDSPNERYIYNCSLKN